MVIISHKPQTTRHRIFGIYNDENHQVVFSDTPGFITTPNYKMQEVMNRSVMTIFEDADLILLVHDVFENEKIDENVLKKIKLSKIPCYLIRYYLEFHRSKY